MKQETLEEAAEKYAEPYRCPATNDNEYCKHDIISAFNNGAKYQAERMYSEEDLIDFAHFYFTEEFNSSMQTSKSTKDIFNEWFETFKNK
jgi:hypothetical protein